MYSTHTPTRARCCVYVCLCVSEWVNVWQTDRQGYVYTAYKNMFILLQFHILPAGIFISPLHADQTP